MTHPNEELLQAYCDAAYTGMEDIRGLFTEGFTSHVPGSNAVSGDYRGRDAAFGFFRQLVDRSDGTVRLRLLSSLADEHFGVAVVEETGTLDGERVSAKKVMVFRIVDGKLDEVWGHFYDQERVNRAWA
jgi:uncharacterized protein